MKPQAGMPFAIGDKIGGFEKQAESGHAAVEVVSAVVQFLVTFAADLGQRMTVKEVHAKRFALRFGQFWCLCSAIQNQSHSFATEK
jgi:hypothetical protein